MPDEVKLLPCEELLRAWQTERSEWHGPTTLEVVREYAEWREARAIEATRPTDEVVDRVAEAIADFLDERFPDGAMPGGQQLFATDHLDAEFKHEAGCDALARAAIAAMKDAASDQPV